MKTFKINYFYFPFLFSFFLPLFIKLSNLFIILFIVFSAYHFLFSKEKIKRNNIVFIYSTVPLFLIFIFGLLITNEPSEGIKGLERIITFILCPLSLFFLKDDDLILIKKQLFNGLVIGSTISILILLVNNFNNYFSNRALLDIDIDIFNYYYTYYNFTDLLNLHPTYLGFYIVFSIFILINKMFIKTNGKFFIFILLMILSFGILFINSRIILLAYVLILVSTLIRVFYVLYKRKYYILVISLFILSSISPFFIYKGFSQTFIFYRFTHELAWETSEQINTMYNSKNSGDSRIARWNSALKVIKRKPFIGYGTNTEKDVLANQYKMDGLEKSHTFRYDAHNLYLSYTIEYGIIGLLVLLFYLFSNIFLAIKSRNLEYFVFFSVIGVICVFESYLKNNAGITFVAFFSAILYFTKDDNQISEQ
tara:strand:+ start:10659 stop:11927 length:1269 start_codon:yes stop_codon:yes gene_type:complete